MKKIPVVVVDDNEADRYIVRRVLSKAEDFDEVLEAECGNVFLEEFYDGTGKTFAEDPPLLILMDVNMPGMNGFETVEELQRRSEAGKGPRTVVVMMFTSSDNPDDRERASHLVAVKGYIQKPLDETDVQFMRSVYFS